MNAPYRREYDNAAATLIAERQAMHVVDMVKGHLYDGQPHDDMGRSLVEMARLSEELANYRAQRNADWNTGTLDGIRDAQTPIELEEELENLRRELHHISMTLDYCRVTRILDEKDERPDEVRLHNAIDMQLAEAVQVLTNGHRDMEADFQAARELAVQAAYAAEYLRYGAAFDPVQKMMEEHQAQSEHVHEWQLYPFKGWAMKECNSCGTRVLA